MGARNHAAEFLDRRQAIVLKRIESNRSQIKTDKPHVEVSWQVTGVRQDAYANARRIPAEELKPEAERGTYLPSGSVHAEAYSHDRVGRWRA